MPHRILRQQIARPVLEICKELRKAEERAWVVGGCVRDTLLGERVNDWDVATTALPEKVQQVFDRVIPTGIDHGTVRELRLDRPPANALSPDLVAAITGAVRAAPDEGAEALVLAGCRQTLETHRPRLSIATHGVQPARATLALLGEHGYRCFGFARDGERRTWRELTVIDADSLDCLGTAANARFRCGSNSPSSAKRRLSSSNRLIATPAPASSR